jgi:recombinational DNA repair protein (RecF pathway)
MVLGVVVRKYCPGDLFFERFLSDMDVNQTCKPLIPQWIDTTIRQNYERAFEIIDAL